jgi:hypothetical protein
VRFQAIGGQVGVVTWFGLAALPESEIFFEQEEGRQKRERAPVFAVEAALCCRSRMCRWAIARPESKKFFGEAAVRNELVRFTSRSLYTE